MASVDSNSVTTYTLNLSEGEAMYLEELTQNYMLAEGDDSEPENDKKHRHNIFNALSISIQLKGLG